MSSEQADKAKPRKGFYLLPNLFTTFGIFCGFYGIIAATAGNFADAGFAIFVAMLMDSFDGRVARMTNTSSEFGAEYDSLADIVSFGVAPALLAYFWGDLAGLGKLGWLASFLFVVCGGLRLARFNVMPETVDKNYFQGLPIPSAAGVVVGFVWFGEELGWSGSDLSILVAIVTTVSGLLMVSNFRYHSFKEVNWKGKVPFVSVVLMVLIIIMVAWNPPVVLFPIFLLYLLSGPWVTLRHKERLRLERKKLREASKNNQTKEDASE
jgi:CDP-diacylglycerol---serine O-phosphatidyltransferase